MLGVTTAEPLLPQTPKSVRRVRSRPIEDGVWAPQRRRMTLGLVLTITLVAFESLAISTVMPVVADDLGGLGPLRLGLLRVLPRQPDRHRPGRDRPPTPGAPRRRSRPGSLLVLRRAARRRAGAEHGRARRRPGRPGHRCRGHPGDRLHERRSQLPAGAAAAGLRGVLHGLGRARAHRAGRAPPPSSSARRGGRSSSRSSRSSCSPPS